MILAEYKKHNPCIAFYNTNNIKKNNMFIVNVRNAMAELLLVNKK